MQIFLNAVLLMFTSESTSTTTAPLFRLALLLQPDDGPAIKRLNISPVQFLSVQSFDDEPAGPEGSAMEEELPSLEGKQEWRVQCELFCPGWQASC